MSESLSAVVVFCVAKCKDGEISVSSVVIACKASFILSGHTKKYLAFREWLLKELNTVPIHAPIFVDKG